MTTQDRSAELKDWIHAIERWKRRQRKLKNMLRGIEDQLRRQEETLEEAMWMVATARTHEQFQEADDLLSEALALAQKEHDSTFRDLSQIYRRLEAHEAGRQIERLSQTAVRDELELVDEASRESFPASDPPSFNPGHA